MCGSTMSRISCSASTFPVGQELLRNPRATLKQPRQRFQHSTMSLRTASPVLLVPSYPTDNIRKNGVSCYCALYRISFVRAVISVPPASAPLSPHLFCIDVFTVGAGSAFAALLPIACNKPSSLGRNQDKIRSFRRCARCIRIPPLFRP